MDSTALVQVVAGDGGVLDGLDVSRLAGLLVVLDAVTHVSHLLELTDYGS